ncbi:MAG: Crp/Fnr family transcriptional regulator, partial [Polyangiales bacterium]
IETAIALNRCLCDYVRSLRRKIAIMTAGSVQQRLATLLLDFDARFGDVSGDDAEVVPVVLTRYELALLIDAAVETTIRAIRRLEKDGVVETTSAGFVLHDRAVLEELAHGVAA